MHISYLHYLLVYNIQLLEVKEIGIYVEKNTKTMLRGFRGITTVDFIATVGPVSAKINGFP